MTQPYFSANLEAQAYLAAIITSSDDAIISKDLSGNITSWNPAAERIFGYKADEAVGKHISLIIPPEFLSEEDYILGQIKQGNRIEHFEATRRHKDGQYVSLSVTISPIRNSEGKIVGASKIARDVTSLKTAERSSAYLGAIVESSDDAIISKDLKGFITSWNKSAERIFGYKADEAIGRHITLLIPSERLDEEDKIIAAIKRGERVHHFETMRRHKDGHLIPVSLTISPIRDVTGEIIGASKISRDISQRVATEEALRQLSLKKDEFLANMSHELRTPMNAVIGLSNLLKGMDLPEPARKFIDTLKISADNLMDLINDLLDFARLESDSIEFESIEFDLAEQIEKAISVINVKAREKNLSLHVHYSASLGRNFIGDPLRIHQVIMNLLSNAVKFTDHGSIEMDISGTPDDRDMTVVTLKVSDTGVGIARDKLNSIFEKFTQSDSSITRRFGGSGLGLAIVKGFIEKMNGTITVNSELGIGSTFIVTLPMKSGTKSSRSAPIGHIGHSVSVEHKNILLVEDYEPNILVAGALLERLGYEYDIARNGFEALRRINHCRYDAILMDVQMHELDGLEATRRIRRIEKEKGLSSIPIIAMTAHVREQDKSKCVEAGMDDFIPKPFNPDELRTTLSRYVTPANA